MIPSFHRVSPDRRKRVFHDISWYTSPIVQSNLSPFVHFPSVTQLVEVPVPVAISCNWLIYDHLTSDFDLLFLCGYSVLFHSWWPLFTHLSLFNPTPVFIHLTESISPVVCQFLPSPLSDKLDCHLKIFIWLMVLRSPNIKLHILEINAGLEHTWICFNSLINCNWYIISPKERSVSWFAQPSN